MYIGGAERSLLDMLSAFDYSKYDVDLFLYRHAGEWISMIPKNVNLLPEEEHFASLAVPMKQLIKTKQYRILYGRVKAKLFAKVFNIRNKILDSYVEIEYSHKYTKKYVPAINKDVKYDLAISFLTPHYFVAEKTNAKKKVAWIHTDYSHIGIDRKSELKMWNQYDNIVSISNSCTKGFIDKFPELKKKIVLIENILSEEFVKKQAYKFSVTDEMKNNENVINILSVGRFSNAKNFDNVPFICKMIREKGLNIKWYLIGYGSDAELIKAKIKQAGMEKYVIILGKKDNPYPYILHCDLYVQPSRYEGKAVTVREAQMLNKPVVITRFPTSYSQLSDGYDGIIVSLDNVECAEEIYQILQNKKLMQSLVDNTKKKNYSNVDEIEKIYNLI